MGVSYKPEGHNSVSPYLAVNGASQTIEFLQDVFGAEEILRMDTEDGLVNHAEVRIDDSVIMLSDSTDQFPAIPAHIHVYVLDVDAVYQLALEAGGTSVQTPAQRGDSDKRGGVMDSGGTTWWISTQVG